MKSERRHELQHNDLAEWSLKVYEQIVPYRNVILAVGLLAVVLVAGVSFWQSHNVAQNGEAWDAVGIPVFMPQFADERTIDAMRKVARDYPGTSASQWATVFDGDTNLMIGENKILTDKLIGVKYVTDAQKLYTDMMSNLTIPGAQEQAMFGKARATESLIQTKEDLENAIKAYQELNEKFPNGMFKALAAERIAELQKKETFTFYETLAKYVPQPKVESPRSQLGNLGELRDNPPSEPPVPTPPVRPGGVQPSPELGVPEPTLKPTEPAKPEAPKSDAVKTEPAKPSAGTSETPKAEPAKSSAVVPGAPKVEPAKPSAAAADVPKSPASSANAAKKDK